MPPHTLMGYLTGNDELETLPFLNEYFDKDSNQTLWSKNEESIYWFDEAAQTKDPEKQLTLFWHQFVGITHIVDQLFQGHGTLLADEVGLGKLLQVIVVMTMLMWQCQVYEETGDFTGLWSKSTCYFYDILLRNIL